MKVLLRRIKEEGVVQYPVWPRPLARADCSSACVRSEIIHAQTTGFCLNKFMFVKPPQRTLFRRSKQRANGGVCSTRPKGEPHPFPGLLRYPTACFIKAGRV